MGIGPSNGLALTRWQKYDASATESPNTPLRISGPIRCHEYEDSAESNGQGRPPEPDSLTEAWPGF